MYKLVIYEILDIHNKCHYVGKTNNISVRTRTHLAGKVQWIDNHMRKHSEEGPWHFEVVEQINDISLEFCEKEIGLAEIDWINFHRAIGSPLKNLAPGGKLSGGPPKDAIKYSMMRKTNAIKQHSNPLMKANHVAAVRTPRARFLKMMNAPKRKQIICLNDPETGKSKIFRSGREAGRYYSINNIWKYCNGRSNKKGLIFKWK